MPRQRQELDAVHREEDRGDDRDRGRARSVEGNARDVRLRRHPQGAERRRRAPLPRANRIEEQEEEHALPDGLPREHRGRRRRDGNAAGLLAADRLQ